MANQMEKKMENEMEPCGYIGVILYSIIALDFFLFGGTMVPNIE